MDERYLEYYNRLGWAQAFAGRRDLNFQVNKMTDSPRGYHYLENYFHLFPMGQLQTEIQIIMHYVPKNKKIHLPTITSITYSVPINFLLNTGRNPDLMPTLLDKAKLEVRRASRKVEQRIGHL